MTTLNSKANMKTQSYLSAGMNPTNRGADFQSAFSAGCIPKPATSRRSVAPVAAPLINTPLQRGVATCERSPNRFSGFLGCTGFYEVSKTAEAVPFPRRRGSAPLKRGVNEIRIPAAALLLSLIWLVLPASVRGQPNYTNEMEVASYVKQMLYWPDATNKNAAAFRYKVLLYTNEAGGIRADEASISALYSSAERARAQTAETELRCGLTNNPTSPLLRGLLLDIYYDRTAAELLVAGNLLGPVERTRLGPPAVPTGLVIDDEINLYRQGLEAYRSALAGYLSLLNDSLGMADAPPAGYQCFQQLVPSRGLGPAFYLSNNVPVSVVGSTNALFSGYKDLVLLYNGLRDYGRAAVPLVRLQFWRNNSGDLAQAKNLLTESHRFLFLHASTLLGIFPGLDPGDTNAVDPASGLAEATAAVSESLSDLDTLRDTLASHANPLGFESDFLMLVQKFVGQSENIFDSFDAFQLRLNPTDLSSPLRYAKDLLAEARDSYADYRGYQDQLESQLANMAGSAEDRLFQIVGSRPGDPGYETAAANEGSEIWQQFQSIETARLRIKKNSVETSNLDEQIRIEMEKTNQLGQAWVQYGEDQAAYTDEITKWKRCQAAADRAADAVSDLGEAFIKGQAWKLLGAVAKGVNAGLQQDWEKKIGEAEANKERLAANQEGKVAAIEGEATLKTLRLNYATLAVDSEEAHVLMKQEVGRLAALLREQADLERTLAESGQDLSGRYFADPVHHLRYQHQTMLANLSFDEAQKWLYFMVRALEYKWNTPFTNYFYLGRRWSSATLFKLRNGEELEQMYNAMVSFSSLVQLPRDDYWDWFSVREDFFGYKMTNDLGQLVYYPDPLNPGGPTNLTGIQAFRRRLQGLTNALGNIVLEFSTAREIPGGTFFRGPRFDSRLQTVLSAGLFLDKIKWLKINLPGIHSLGRSQLAGEITYGGSSFIRNFDVGHFVPGRPDRLADELTAYGSRYWFFHPPSAAWRFSAALKSPVTMQLSADPRVPPTVQEIDIFKERSVANTGWVLSIPTQDLGVPVLKIDELNDVELYFYHYAVSRQMPEGTASAPRERALPLNIPFPYHLKYHSNPEEGEK